MATPTISSSASLSIIDLIGDTPLIRLRRIERARPGVELYAKDEWTNPGGSVKDRPALAGPILHLEGAPIPAARRASTGQRAARKAGALVVLTGGALVLYVERGGKSLLSFSDDPAALAAAADALALAVRDGALGRLTVERADGAGLLGSDHPLAAALEAAGFHPTPRGLRLRR